MTEGSGPLATLRAAVARLDDLHESPPGDDAGFDPVEHATRFEALHDELVAVLAEVEHTEQAQNTEQAQHTEQARQDPRARG